MITVNNINPSKNATGVPVNQDLEIRISADFKLDPRNISFRLNEVDIIPNVFSIYHGDTDHELVVTLYTRKRIKFGDIYRYGQDGLRYGMRDIFPSMLNYDSRYVCSFKVWGTNDNNEKEEITDSFVFTTEQGIFYNNTPPTYFYSDYTQQMANKLPEWARARYDKYSNFQQLMNPLGEILEKNQDLIDKIFRAGNIQTVDLKELSHLYRYELDKNFEFKSLLNQDGSMYFVQPEISGIQGITRFDLFTTEENDLKSMYYGKIPTRIDTKQITVRDNTIVYETIASELEIKINKELEREGSFVLYCTGVNTSIIKDINNNYSLVKCRIKGRSIFDAKQEEEIVLYDERYLFTRKLWKSIESIQFFNLNKQQIVFKILHFPYESKLSSDFKRMIQVDGSTDNLIWSFENRNGLSILQKRRTIGENALDVLIYAGETEVISEMGLYDIDNTSPLELKDIAVDYNSNLIYGVTDDHLYIFDKREPYPKNLKKIPGDSSDSDLALALETDGTFINEDGIKEVSIKCIHAIPGKRVLKYRIKITMPDGSIKFLLKNSTLETDPNKSSIFVKQTSFLLEDIFHNFVATEPGEYVFELEVLYQGGTVSRDYAFLHIVKNVALAKYKLARILNDSRPICIFIDADQEVKIYTNASILHTIDFHKDGIIIDYINKVIYSCEEYTSIDVD